MSRRHVPVLLLVFGLAVTAAPVLASGRVLFQERFARPVALEGWDFFPPGWAVVERTLVSPGGTSNQVAWPQGHDGADWDDYYLQGRFRLNAAKEATLVFHLEDPGDQGNPDSGRYMQVFNAADPCGSTMYAIHAPYGSTAYSPDPTVPFGPGCVGNQIAPDAWHSFRIRVRGNAVDYYLDGVRIIQVLDVDYWCNDPGNAGCYVGSEGLSYRGGIGVKGVGGAAGAQFDDLVVHRLRPAQ